MKLFTSVFFTGLCLGISCASANASIDETRNTLEQWIETQQIISEEQNDWKVEQSILEETRTLLNNELERLSESISELEISATAADEKRNEINRTKDTLKSAADTIAVNVAALEAKTFKILPLLPEPLTERINPLIRRLPKDPETTSLSLGERVQNIVGILSQANKFNNTITLTSEVRTVDNTTEVQVNTLYWGLAIAYFVDASGEYAGISYPSANGWQTSSIANAGLQIRELISVYEGDGDIKFVEVPAKIN